MLIFIWDANYLFIHIPVPHDGFLVGCVFVIADYPEQIADKQLLATWKRVRWTQCRTTVHSKKVLEVMGKMLSSSRNGTEGVTVCSCRLAWLSLTLKWTL